VFTKKTRTVNEENNAYAFFEGVEKYADPMGLLFGVKNEERQGKRP
jgi:hypothetical protein